MKIARLDSSDGGFNASLDRLLYWEMGRDSEVERTVFEVLQAVRSDGDKALLSYTQKFDRLAADSVAELELSQQDLQQALKRIDAGDRRALEAAAKRITTYHEHQVESSWSYEDEMGNQLGQKISPLERVGVYVPGGQASYPSSVLMTLLPAKVAGVEQLIVTVPTPNGKRNDMVLAALAIAGVDSVFTIGGAQAIGALAYGTQTISRVDKIVGPGGAYVAAAKRQVFGHVGIDMIAGPSEVLVIADGTTDARWIALDLFSQAEHDASAQAILLCTQREYLDEVADHMQKLLPTMQRKDIIAKSLENRGALILTRDLDEAVAISNRVAPEHLELHVSDPDQYLAKIKHAGAIFCGALASEALGDYAMGPSHVLPTFGTARFASPLGVYDFQKRSSVMRVSAAGAAQLAAISVPIATAEGFQAHANAAAARAQQINS